MKGNNYVITTLQSKLQIAIGNLKESELSIKKNTDKWVKNQKEIIDIDDALNRLGYEYKYKYSRGMMFPDVILVRVNINKKK